jgi:hypothetical protein
MERSLQVIDEEVADIGFDEPLPCDDRGNALG